MCSPRQMQAPDPAGACMMASEGCTHGMVGGGGWGVACCLGQVAADILPAPVEAVTAVPQRFKPIPGAQAWHPGRAAACSCRSVWSHRQRGWQPRPASTAQPAACPARAAAWRPASPAQPRCLQGQRRACMAGDRCRSRLGSTSAGTTPCCPACAEPLALRAMCRPCSWGMTACTASPSPSSGRCGSESSQWRGSELG